MSAPGARAPRGRSEVAFVTAAAWAVVVTAVLTVPLATLLAGTPGMLGALAALAFVVVLFGVSSGLHLLAAGHGRDVWLAVTVGGLGLRLVLYLALVRVLGAVESLDGTALALSAAAGVVVGQVLEVRALARVRTADVMRAGPPAGVTRQAAGSELEGVDR